MGKNLIVAIYALEGKNISGSATTIPKRYEVTVFLSVKGVKKTRSKVAGESIKGICLRDVECVFLPIGVHVLHSYPGILR